MRHESNYTLFPNDVDFTESVFAMHIRGISGYPETSFLRLKTLPIQDIYEYEHPEEMLPVVLGTVVKRSDGRYLIHKNHSACSCCDNHLFYLQSIVSCSQVPYLACEDMDSYIFSLARVNVAQDFGLLLSEEEKSDQARDTTYGMIYDPTEKNNEDKVMLVKVLEFSLDETDNIIQGNQAVWLNLGEIRWMMATGELKLNSWSRHFMQHA